MESQRGGSKQTKTVQREGTEGRKEEKRIEADKQSTIMWGGWRRRGAKARTGRVEETEAARVREERDAGTGRGGGGGGGPQSRPGQAWGQGAGQGAACPVFAGPSVCPQELSAVFHSIRLAGLPRASCPLGSLSMSGGGRRWRKQLQE